MLLLRRRSSGGGVERWLSLVGLLLAVFYLAFVWIYLQVAGLFDYMGFDYRVFLASAEIATSRGFAAVYFDGDPDLPVQEEFQRPIYEAYATGPGRANYATGPMYYLPAFLLLFLPMLLLPPGTGFVVWTALNGAVLLLYLWRFVRALGDRDVHGALALVVLSYPAFLTLFLGQVNVLLLVVFGEFLLATMRGQAFRGGLWLGGLLLKPQTLVLILPGLLLQSCPHLVSLVRRGRGRPGEGTASVPPRGSTIRRPARPWERIGWPLRVLLGLALSGLGILALSLLLAGIEGLRNLGRQLFFYPGIQSTTAPRLMMNWRGLGANLALWLPSPVAGAVAIAGLALTVGVALSLWWRPADPASPRFFLILFGTYAATCAITWHAHIHMALPLAVPLLYLYARRRLSPIILALWAALPAVVFFVAAILLPGVAANLAGLGMFVLNLGLVGWAIGAFWRGRPPRMAGPAAAGDGDKAEGSRTRPGHRATCV